MTDNYENVDPGVRLSLIINDLEMSSHPELKLKGTLSKAIAHQSVEWLQENANEHGALAMFTWIEVTTALLVPIMLQGAKPGTLPLMERAAGMLFKEALRDALRIQGAARKEQNGAATEEQANGG